MFFALWPDAGVRDQLMRQGLEMHHLLGGKLTREESVHLTLVFLGGVLLERLPDLQARAASVRFEPFALPIERAGCWRHNNIAWVGPNQTPATLVTLVADLEQALVEEGFRFDRRPYAAHITLLRKARCVPMDSGLAAFDWNVSEFVLVRSHSSSEGSRYVVVGRWPAQQKKEGSAR